MLTMQKLRYHTASKPVIRIGRRESKRERSLFLKFSIIVISPFYGPFVNRSFDRGELSSDCRSVVPTDRNGGVACMLTDIFSLKHESGIFRSGIQPRMWFLHNGTG